jgi:hypothetical protein
MEIYFVFFFPPAKKEEGNSAHIAHIGKPHKPTLQAKLCQRVQFLPTLK